MSERMFFSLIRIEPLPEKRDRLLEILISVAGHTRLIAGCSGCMVSEERGNGNAVLYLERWRSREALHRHVRSGLYIRVLHAMDLAGEPPEVFFYEISGEKGLDLIRELRQEEQENACGPSLTSGPQPDGESENPLHRRGK